MLCQKCHQRQATVFFSQTVGSQTTQSHLCEVCAQEQTQTYGGAIPFGVNPFAALSDFLNNFMSWGEGAMEEVNTGRAKTPMATPQLQCPHCGYQLSFFRQNGRLGCTQCYESFKSALEPLISNIHGNNRHVEENVNAPSGEQAGQERRSQKPEVAEMRKKIDEAIKAEKYEEAARLRDEIKKLEGK